MSMLTMQIDKLRKAARNIQGNLGRCCYRRKDVNEMQQVSDMLREAANTIESLWDRLQAAELGSGTCRLHYGEDDDGYDGWYCDECGGWFQAVRRDGHLVEPKYCQECGAKVVD